MRLLNAQNMEHIKLSKNCFERQWCRKMKQTLWWIHFIGMVLQIF